MAPLRWGRRRVRPAVGAGPLLLYRRRHMPRRLKLRPLLRVLATLLVVMLAASCQATVDVTVVIEDEAGSGEVTVVVQLDADAVERLEGVDGLRVDDLVTSGWEVEDPEVGDEGGAVITATKSFASPSDLTSVLEEISGPDGPYAQLGLRTERSFAESNFRIEGVLDGTGGVQGFADPGLAEALDGMPFGVDIAALEAELGAPVGSLVTLRLAVGLPGELDDGDPSSTSYTVSADGTQQLAVWETTLDAADPIPVLATSEVSRFRSVAFVIAAAGFALLFLLILITWAIVALRRRRKRRKAARAAASAPRPIPGLPPRDDADDTPTPPEESVASVPASASAGDDTSEPTAADAAPQPPPLELVIIGGPGVAFGVRDPVDEVVAFARANGSMLEYPRIAEHYAQAELGRMSTAELWVAVGAEGDPGALDDDFLGQYQLAPGLREFVARARASGFRVAYLGDGPATWVAQLRQSFVLTDLIDPWIVSSAVGARTPDPAIFEAMRRSAAVAPEACLLIDDRLRVLEAAREKGFGTAWYSPTGRAKEAPGHSIIRGFADLLSS